MLFPKRGDGFAQGFVFCFAGGERFGLLGQRVVLFFRLGPRLAGLALQILTDLLQGFEFLAEAVDLQPLLHEDVLDEPLVISKERSTQSVVTVF